MKELLFFCRNRLVIKDYITKYFIGGDILELSAVCLLGKINKEKITKELGEDPLNIFVENPNDTGAYNTVLEIIVDESFNYIETKVSEFKNEYISKYLYKKGSSNGTDFTPTAKITTPEKTFKNKIINSFKETIDAYKKTKDVTILENILHTLDSNQKKILDDINGNFDSKKGNILTVVYDNKYIGDIEIFKDKLRTDAVKSYYLIEGKESKGLEKTCSICKEKNKEVYGNANIFKFYTVDKEGYVAGGFRKLDSWRNFPVCFDCAVELELGKRYLDEKLSLKFQSRDFYLIPKLVFEKDLNRILSILEKLKDEFLEETYETREEMMFKRLQTLENYMSFDLLFYEENNSALNIKLNVQEVLPSRFRKLYESLSNINELMKSCNRSEKLRIDFRYLNTIFPRKTHNRYFLEVVDIILSDKRIDYKFIISHITNHIIEKFNEDEGRFFYHESIKSYGFLLYLRLLNVLFKEKGQVKKMSKLYWDIKDYNTREELFNNFFNENMDFFSSPDKKAIFLIGFLSQKLINIQMVKEQRAPFINRLKGLKLGKKDIKRLLPDIHNKFIEYDAQYYKDIQALASNYLMLAGEKWAVTELDIPFYFSMGMNLEKHIKLTNKEEVENND